MRGSEYENGRAEGDGAPVGQGLGLGPVGTSSTASHTDRSAPSFTFSADELEHYRETEYELIPLHAPGDLDRFGRSIGKAPFKGWRTSPHITVDEAIAHLNEGGNVGVRLRQRDLVVDVDPRNFAAGDDPVSRLERALGFRLSEYPHVVTGSGGAHYYMRLPESLPIRDSLPEYEGVEFKSFGRQVVAAGSAHPGAGRAYLWDCLTEPLASVRMVPERLLEMIRRPDLSAPLSGGGELSPDQLASLLLELDAVDYRDHAKWLELMMACHHATSGEGREEWVSWSTSDPHYAQDGHRIGRRWDSLHADHAGRRVTVRTLYKHLSDAGKAASIPRDTAEEDFADDPPEVRVGDVARQPAEGS